MTRILIAALAVTAVLTGSTGGASAQPPMHRHCGTLAYHTSGAIYPPGRSFLLGRRVDAPAYGWGRGPWTGPSPAAHVTATDATCTFARWFVVRATVRHRVRRGAHWYFRAYSVRVVRWSRERVYLRATLTVVVQVIRWQIVRTRRAPSSES